MLKRILQKIIKEQKGQMLPIVLILMLLSGLLIVPTLNYASSSLKVKQVTEKKTLELYAADAGVEDALYYLSQLVDNWSDGTPAPPDVGPYAAEKLTGHGPTTKYCYKRDERLVINDKIVKPITVRREESEGSQYYNITSTATSADDAGDSSTTVTSYVEFTDFSCLFDKLVTSKENITGTGAGDVPEEEKEPYYTGPWPTAEQLREYYREQVTADPFSSGYLDVSVNTTIPVEGLYSDVVDGFDIEGESSDEENKLTLEGTVYIEGDLLRLGSESSKFFTLDLNEQTIFVEGDIETGNSLSLTVSGSGCIIAEGAIYFAPGIQFDPAEFVFIMSVTDEVTIWPNNTDFNGSIAGADTVELRSGTGSYNHTDPPDGLNFPVGGTDAPITILSWQIS